MNSIIEYLSAIDLAGRWSTTVADLQNEFDKLSINLTGTIHNVQQLDNSLLQLNEHLKAFNTSPYLFRNNFSDKYTQNDAEDIADDMPGLRSTYETNYKKEYATANDHYNLAGTVQEMAKLGEGAIKVREAFGEIPPVVKNLKNTFGITGDINEGVTGIADMFSGTASGLTALETTTAGSEIMAGAAGVAETGTVFGPPGWIAGIGALAIGGVAAASVSEHKGNSYDFKDFTSGRWKKFYWDQEKQKDREKLIDLYNVTNYKQLDDIENELNSDYLTEDRIKRVDEALRNQKIEFPDLRNKWVQSNKQNDISGKTSMFFTQPASIISPKEKLAIEEKNIWDAAGMDSHFYGKPIDIKKVNEEISELKKKANLPQTPKEPIYRIPTDEEWGRYERGLPTPPLSEKPVRQHNKRKLLGNNIVPPGFSTGRIININLNKPMIENFTISANGMNEGIKDFKHKVEEVLLEILNSANAIQ